MSTRTLENPKDRIVTMMAIPFMSCSARLPVYLLFVAAFFAKNQGLILLSIYLLGILMAIITALLLKKTVFKGDSEQFVMELPPYRIPSARNTLIHMWEKAVQYLKKMGSVILVASIIIWALCYFPTRNNETDRIDEQLTQIDASSDLTEDEKEEQRTQLEIDRAAVQSENSYLGKIGKIIEPAIHPLGFNWKMGVSILTGAAAKEIVVSSMGILYHADQEADEESEKLITALRSPQGNDKPITPLVAYGFMTFILLYFPCIASLTAVAKEANWKWMVFSILYTTSVAWIVSFLIYQIGSMF